MCIIFLSMDNHIYELSLDLKKSLDNDPRIIKLNELEKKMNEDKEVIALAYAKDVASSEYSDILNHYSQDSETAKKYQKKLYAAKKALDEHPLVKEYLKAYVEVRNLYSEINAIVFKDLNPELCPKGK